MSKHHEYNELIDKYLDGSMTAHQKHDFEAMLEKDPLLERDFQIQQDVVNALKSYRKAELKNRLNNINIDSSSSGINAAKVLGSLAVASLLITGTFFYINRGSQPESEDALLAIDHAIDEEREKENNEAIVLNLDDQVLKSDGVVEVTEEAPEEAAMSEDIPAFSEMEEEEETAATSEEIVTPGSDRAVEGRTIRREAFHYQFHNNKLRLYGDFKGMQILSMSTDEGKKLFMSYDGSFYRLDPSKKELTPLEEVQDSDTISHLKTLLQE